MCGQRLHEQGRDHWASGSLLDPDSTLESGYLVSDAERDAALAARTTEQLRLALRGLPRPVGKSEGGPVGPVGRPRWIPLPVLILVVVALVATHGWALIPLAWLLFGFFGPWRRHHGHRRRRMSYPGEV